MKNPNPKERQTNEVCEMFSRIAPKYDKINRLMTFGLDIKWRKNLAKLIFKETKSEEKILDLACGSGDVSLALLRQNPDAKILSADICPEMLEIAKEKIFSEGFDPNIAIADAENLQFADAEFSACCIAFGFRNFRNRKKSLEEIARVLKSGGGLYLLEVARAPKFFLPFQNFFMEKIMPNLAVLFGAKKADYVYLAQTTRDFPSQGELKILIESCGFKNLSFKYHGFGCVAITKAYKI